MTDKSKRLENLSPLKRALLAVEEMRRKLEKLEREKHEPIAVVGMSCKFPGANDCDEYLELLENGVDAITEVPKERWDIDEYYDPEPAKTGKMVTRYGGFIEDVDKFDTKFFGISPREAMKMDPQQRLLLETVWNAFENAGIKPSSLKKSKTGVFIGISNNDYTKIQNGEIRRIDAYTGSGNAFSIAANRISYLYDFQGPSIAVDTACSSSLVTIHMAIQSLRNKESDYAVAGGVNLILSPELTITFSQAHMMSPTGRCKTFSADADGYVRGEGCGIVILKRLSDAVKDGDRILSVIRGSAVNQDGKSNGLTAPNSFAQKRVILDALKNAKLKPEDIQYVETHGTGTILGDPIEIEALGMVMENRTKDNPCYLGAVKSNIGHLEAAAGIAGFIKTVLMLKHKFIPETLHFTKINPHIPIDELPFIIQTEKIKWDTLNKKRIAGVSSFGFGGTNAHVILEEYPEPEILTNETDRTAHLLTLSAKDKESVRSLAHKFSGYLQKHTEFDFADVCYTRNVFREHFGNRAFIVAKNTDDAVIKLNGLVQNPDFFIKTLPVVSKNPEKIAFMFTGQGAQYFGMGRELYETSPTYKKHFDECAAIIQELIGESITGIISGNSNKADLINETRYTQIALFVVEYALAKLWMSWGIKPDYLIGHSVGEVVAAVVSNVMTLEDGLKFIEARGRLMQSLPRNGAMSVVFAGFETVSGIIKDFENEVSIAAVNGPANIVISGKIEAMGQIDKILNSKNINSKKLNVSHAFHSPLMEPVLEEFERTVKEMKFGKPEIPIVSNLTGKLITEAEFSADYWRNHIRNAVLFEPGMNLLNKLGCNVFIEIGPQPVLTGMAKRFIDNENVIWVGSLKKEHSDWDELLNGVGTLFTSGVKIDFKLLDSDYKRNFVDVPTYAFLKERYWFDDLEKKPASQTKPKVEPEIEIEDKFTFDEKELLKSLSTSNEEEKTEKLKNYLRSAVAHVLRLKPENVNPDSSITNLGLDSIVAMELRARLQNALGIEIPVAKLIEGPSINNLTGFIIEQINSGSTSRYPEVKIGRESTGTFPLSYGQKAMWFQHQMAPDSIFNPAYAVKVKAGIDIDLLKKSFIEVVKRHPQLRTTFKYEDGEPKQKIKENYEIYFKIEELDNKSIDDLKPVLNRNANQVFDLENGPLFKIYLYKLDSNDYILQMVAHHIVMDMWSQAIIVFEVGQLYNSKLGNVQLPDNQIKYTDFVDWQNELINGEYGSELLDYWQKELEGPLPVLALPLDRTRPPVQTFKGKTETLIFDAELSNKIKELSKKLNTTDYVVLLSAFNILLNKYTGQNDIIVGTPTTGRTVPEFENIVGYFVNPVPVRSKIVNEESFARFVENTRNKVVEAVKHQDYPVNLLVEKLKIKRDPSRSPLFQTMFIYQQAHLLNDEGLSGFAIGKDGMEMKLGGLPVESVNVDDMKSPFDISMMMAETEHGFGASITYNTALFENTTVLRMLKHFEQLLKNIVKNENIKNKNIEILTGEEKELLLNKWNNKNVQFPEFENVVDWFDEVVKRYPGKNAVVSNGKAITYEELNKRVNKLANYILGKGIKRDDIIGICLDRSIEQIISLFAVIKAGAAYLPIDCEYPRERIKYIIEDSGINYLITESNFIRKLENEKYNTIILTNENELINVMPDDNPPVKINGSNLAYVIYTSGSTGKPKGVQLSHLGLCNLVKEQIKKFKINENSRVLQFASFSFDASVSEIFTALLSGGQLHLTAQEEIISGFALINKLRNEKITNCTLPPSVLNVLQSDNLPDLKVLVSAGELCGTDIPKKWGEGRTFINAYGPTEATVCSTTFEANSGNYEKSLPIGKPIENVNIYILNENLQMNPVGIPGEIYISGLNLARGYKNKPDLTAEKFLPDPFSKIPGARMYATGDLGKYNINGDIEFLGRIDHQVKFRGFRIELGEIEEQINAHPLVEQSYVVAIENSNGEQRLVAYYIRNKSANGDEIRLKEFLRDFLPDYMIPGFFMELDEFPLTPNGKIDRQALPQPVMEKSNIDFVKPTNETEKKVAEIWQEILDVENIGSNDNFFDLGGHSLNVIQVQTKVKEVFDKELSVVDLFKYPTVSSFAKYLINGGTDLEEKEKKMERANKQKMNLALQRERMKMRGRTK